MFVTSYAPFGADGIIIRVEADIRRGIPGIDISGLAEGAVREARERVQAGFRNSGLVFPPHRILINLAPAGVRKDGAFLDLPIALSVMAAAGLVSPPPNLMALGELELSGRVRPVRGVLAAVAAGLREGIRDFIVPEGNAREAAILAENGARIAAVAALAEAVHVLAVHSAGFFPDFVSTEKDVEKRAAYKGDFSVIRGQERYKRALEIAAAGGHNLLVFGPPGAGKTMLARSFPSVMAPLTSSEAVEVTRLYSLAGRTLCGEHNSGGLITDPPFRSPHHSASAEGILGGGKWVRPGEISLAHYGVLFLDEAPSFRANVLMALREPLEDQVITISRAEGPVRLPAEFQLLLAANSCPCGRLGLSAAETESAGAVCCCSGEEITRYWRKFGGALLDRIELRVPVLPPGGAELASPAREEGSAVIAARVRNAVEIQRERFRKGGCASRRNARIPAGLVDSLCPLTDRGKAAFGKAAAMLGLSGRAWHGILKTARTIADLDGKDVIDAVHILEAAEHRRFGDDPYDALCFGNRLE
ncbi:MAG: YifB family Mg chelatase-like AAA ATPase [Treponema sp.]|jgi:magnesium chelatase family protein|nr:YifB family Mg chelatase-like AAA ATPase [Treponema sp.]